MFLEPNQMWVTSAPALYLEMHTLELVILYNVIFWTSYCTSEINLLEHATQQSQIHFWCSQLSPSVQSIHPSARLVRLSKESVQVQGSI
jgi:hypothetical protein